MFELKLFKKCFKSYEFVSVKVVSDLNGNAAVD